MNTPTPKEEPKTAPTATPTASPPVRRIIVAPSILAADPGRFADEIAAIEAGGADVVHVDVMDGHFVPNLTFGPPVIRALRKRTRLPFDVHLMIERPEDSLLQYIDAGADMVTVHIEAASHLHRTLGAIRDAGAKAGVSLNPATPISGLAYVLDLLDLVLVMSVNPGFGGQRFIPAVLPKIAAIRALALEHKRGLMLSVDGGVDAKVIPSLVEAGADVFVAGSAVFGTKDYGATMAQMRAAAASTCYKPSGNPALTPILV